MSEDRLQRGHSNESHVSEGHKHHYTTNENVNSYKNTSKAKLEEGNLIYADNMNIANGKGMMEELVRELSIKSKSE